MCLSVQLINAGRRLRCSGECHAFGEMRRRLAPEIRRRDSLWHVQ